MGSQIWTFHESTACKVSLLSSTSGQACCLISLGQVKVLTPQSQKLLMLPNHHLAGTLENLAGATVRAMRHLGSGLQCEDAVSSPCGMASDRSPRGIEAKRGLWVHSRWFTSWFVHQSFVHVTSNMALLLVVAYQIEEKYGFWRITLLYFISALGGEACTVHHHKHCTPLYALL